MPQKKSNLFSFISEKSENKDCKLQKYNGMLEVKKFLTVQAVDNGTNYPEKSLSTQRRFSSFNLFKW